MRDYLNLVRVYQWYKNLFVFLGFFFFEKNVSYEFEQLLIVFFGFCAVSSMTYIINDLVDVKKDKIHPIKKNRPLASGKVSRKEAFVILMFLCLIVFCSVYFLNLFYGLIVFIYFVFTNLYSFGFKNIPVLDSVMIGFNFMLRFMAGFADLPDQSTFYYFLIIFLSTILFVIAKRRADSEVMGDKALEHKPVIRFYTKNNSMVLFVIFYIALIISFHFTEIIFYKYVLMLFWLFGTNVVMWKHPDICLWPYKIIREYLWDIGTVLLILILFFL